MKADKHGKDTFRIPAPAGAGRKAKNSPVAKEPPYRDLPSDPVRPPQG